ncbi:MAG: hypothetical protein LBI27_05665 [Clostridiales bacterium]|jgi:hypothetical protein|nr:hypothetical protein [Clostridiales bacterium]
MKIRILCAVLVLSVLLWAMPAAVFARTPTLESEMHNYTGAPFVASSAGDLAIPVDRYMRVNTRMNGGASNSLPFFNRPSTASCNKVGDIPNGSTVYVYGVTAAMFENQYWALIDYNGRFGLAPARWIEDTSVAAPDNSQVQDTESIINQNQTPTPTPTPQPAPQPTPQPTEIVYPPAPYFSYGGGEDIVRDSSGEITRVTYYNTCRVRVGYSEFTRATDRFSFIRTDYWYENSVFAYYVVNELDTRGDLIIARFYYPDGTLFDTVRQ